MRLPRRPLFLPFALLWGDVFRVGVSLCLVWRWGGSGTSDLLGIIHVILHIFPVSVFVPAVPFSAIPVLPGDSLLLISGPRRSLSLYGVLLLFFLPFVFVCVNYICLIDARARLVRKHQC